VQPALAPALTLAIRATPWRGRSPAHRPATLAAVTISAVSTRAVLQAATRRGADPEALLRPHGLELALLEDPDARLPAEVVADLWRRASQAAGEPELAVLAAVELPRRAYRVLDYLASSAATIGEALGLVSRYFLIVHDAVQLQVGPDGEGGVLRIGRADGVPLPAPYVDYALASCLYRMGHVSDGPVHAHVSLRRPAPGDRTGHQQAFGPNLRFEADRDEARLPPALWRRPTTAADPVLRELLEAHAQGLVERLSGPDSLSDLRAAALEAMRAGRPELSWIARRLDTSSRTLQRRLMASGTSWRELLESLRREAASAWLQDPALSVDDVAVLLGYAEASTFHRAFRRWTGQSPGAWRQKTREKTT
jgi:AraC-like DNA-binding protein